MRTAEEIRAQQLLYNQSSLTSAVSGLPPSYIEGFKHTVDRFYRVTVGAGVTTVQGTRVEITADTFLRDADWLCVKTTDSGSFYYVYLTRTGLLKVDRTAPTYSGTYFYYQHPTFGYRSIGKLWASSAGNILWASSNFTAYSNQLTTAQTGYLGYADYYVDTDEDASIKFQMANDYLYGAFNGGANTIQRGTYTIENTVTLNYGVTFRGEGEQTLINVNTVGTNGFEYGGATSFGCAIESCKIVNIETTAQDKYLIDFNGSPKGKVYNSILDYTKCAGILNDGSNNSIINNTMSGGQENDFSYGIGYEFNGASTQYVRVASLSASKFVAVYRDVGDSNKGKAIVGEINGTVITYGSEITVNNANTERIDVCALTDSLIVISYDDSGGSGNGELIAGTVSGTTITFGSVVSFGGNDCAPYTIKKLSSSSFVVCFQASTPFPGQVAVGTVSGTTITKGTDTTFNTGATSYIDIGVLSPTEIVVAYRDDAGSTYGKAIYGSISGTTPTFGTEVTFQAAQTDYISVCGISSTQFIIAYAGSASPYGRLIVGTVASTVITYGTSFPFTTSAVFNNLSPTGGNTFILAYEDTGNSNYGTVIAGFVYGNNVTLTNSYVFNAINPTVWIGASYIGDNKSVIGYYNATASGASCKIVTVDIANVFAITSSGSNAIIQANHITADDTYVQEVGIYVSGDENIVANNQIDGISGSDRNIKVGLLVTSDSVRSQIVSNSVKNNLNYGFVNYGTNTSFAQNVAFNNGSDTGIANANQQNYLDAGTGTQISNNAWQSPVNTEPSVGTLHALATVATILNGTDPTDTNWHEIDLSSIVPIGTKAIQLQLFVQSTNAGPSFTISGANGSLTGLYLQQNANVANTLIAIQGVCSVSSDRKIYYQASSANVSLIYLYGNGYYL